MRGYWGGGTTVPGLGGGGWRARESKGKPAWTGRRPPWPWPWPWPMEPLPLSRPSMMWTSLSQLPCQDTRAVRPFTCLLVLAQVGGCTSKQNAASVTHSVSPCSYSLSLRAVHTGGTLLTTCCTPTGRPERWNNSVLSAPLASTMYHAVVCVAALRMCCAAQCCARSSA